MGERSHGARWRLGCGVTALLVALMGEPAYGQPHSIPLQDAAESDGEPRHTPDFLMMQSAGFVGYVAAGMGWHPSPRHELALLVGHVPESVGGVDLWQFALKYNWRPLRPVRLLQDGQWTPFHLGMSVIRGWHNNLWVRQPAQYPEGYYPPTALSFTFNVGTSLRRRGAEVFLEFAALDYGLVAFINNPGFFQNHYPYGGLAGIGSLAFGIKVEWP